MAQTLAHTSTAAGGWGGALSISSMIGSTASLATTTLVFSTTSGRFISRASAVTNSPPTRFTAETSLVVAGGDTSLVVTGGETSDSPSSPKQVLFEQIIK